MSTLLLGFLISLMAALWVWITVRKNPAGRPWLTVLCLGVLLVLPLLAVLPKYHLKVVGSTVPVSAFSEESSVWTGWLMLWIVGCLVMLLRMVIGYVALAKWVRESRPAIGQAWQSELDTCVEMLGMKSYPELRVKSGIQSPVVTGILRPVVLMPEGAEQWRDETRRMALLHELAHVQRKDLWLRLAADLTCVLHWCNPLVWWMRSKLLSQCEYACDARVVAAGADKKSYVSALCDVVEWAMLETRPRGVVAMADHAPLATRVDYLFVRRRSGGKWLAVLAAVLTVTTSLGVVFIRPLAVSRGGEGANQVDLPMMQHEVELRHAANPFPGNAE